MADFPIDIRIDTSAQSKLTPLNRQLDKTDSSASAATVAVRALSGVIAGLAAANVVGGAIRVNQQFNKSISELSAITGATGRDLQFLTAASKEFGATTTLSASQAATAFKLIASAKPDLLTNVEALKAVTREAITLSEAAGIDLPNAANALGNALNQFGEEADQANRFINVLAAGAKFGSSSIEETSQALTDAGVSAANAKLSFEETNAAIQALATSGIRGARAGTGLRNVLTILDTATDEQLRPSVVGLSQALDNLASQQLDNTEFVKLFGRENQNAARILLNQRDNFKSLTTALTGTNTAFEQASTRTDNLDGDLKALASAFEGVQIEAAALADGGLRQITQALTAGLADLNENPEKIAEAISTLGDVATATATILAGRLVGSVAATSTAFIAGQIQAVRYQVALATMAGVSRTAAVGITALGAASTTASRALALLGGPIGLIALAATAFVVYAERAETAEDRSRRLSTELDKLADSYQLLGEEQLRQEYASQSARAFVTLPGEIAEANRKLSESVAVLAKEQRKLQRAGRGQAEYGSTEASRTAQKDIARLRDTIAELTEEKLISEAAVSKLGTTLAELGESRSKALKTVEESTTGSSGPSPSDAIEEEIDALQRQFTALQLVGEERAVYEATSKLSAEATSEQVLRVKELTEEIYRQNEALQAQQDLEQFDRSAESPIERLNREAEEVRQANQLALDAQLQDQQAFAERELEIDKKLAADKLKIQQANRSAIYQSSAQGFDALAGLISAAGGKQTAAYRVAFAASRAFALADSIAKVAQAQAQALADPTAVTLPQKIANYAAVASAGASVISGLREPAGFKDGGYTGNIGVNDVAGIVHGREYVMPAHSTSQYRSELEAMRRGTFNGGSGSSPRVTIINNISDIADTTVAEGPDGELIATIDRRIADQTPGIVAEQLSDPYSNSTSALENRYRLERN